MVSGSDPSDGEWEGCAEGTVGIEGVWCEGLKGCGGRD